MAGSPPKNSRIACPARSNGLKPDSPSSVRASRRRRVEVRSSAKIAAPSVADTIADGGLHGRYVFGHGRPIGRDEPVGELVERLSTFRVRLIKNGSVAATGGGDLVLGSPLNALAYLVKRLASLPDFSQ